MSSRPTERLWSEFPGATVVSSFLILIWLYTNQLMAKRKVIKYEKWWEGYNWQATEASNLISAFHNNYCTLSLSLSNNSKIVVISRNTHTKKNICLMFQHAGKHLIVHCSTWAHPLAPNDPCLEKDLFYKRIRCGRV